MNAAAKATGKGEATRESIVRMAHAHAKEVGLEAISLGVLASSLQLSKSGLFAHFKSKEALQLAVLDEAIDDFRARVIAPALGKPRGEPRVRALFDNKMAWMESNGGGVGCFFQALAQEYDDRPGPIRDRLAQSERDWRDVIAKAVTLAIHERHFHADVDPQQFAFEQIGIDSAYQQARKLLDDDGAKLRAERAFERLLADAHNKKRR